MIGGSLLRRARLVSTRKIYHRYASSALANAEVGSSEDQQDGYGMDYGPGPSRIPYQPRDQSQNAHRSETTRPEVRQFPELLAHAPASSLRSAQSIRQSVTRLQHGDYTNLLTFVKKALALESTTETATAKKKRRQLPPLRPISVLSRLELHVLIHHLIRVDQHLLAAAILSEAIETGVASRPKRRRLFADRTVGHLVSSLARPEPDYKSPKSKSKSPTHATSIQLTPFTSNQQVVVIADTRLSRRSRALLRLLESMQEVRHRRSHTMYEQLIKKCIQEGRPDAAAKVFVGLVEEWVTEGRVAEGADVDDFCEGGGPNEKLEIQLVSDQMATWWQGVRTWKLPGEVLSPHGRMDLWHPKNLSLGEKMKGFPMPMPTSPPSMVPAPNNDLLLGIIESLQIDPEKCTLEDFQASMRALAYLANTVLARTLPVASLRSLFQAMAATKHRPAVYPESIDIATIPASDRWAYESFTQIHLALQSLLSAPPMSTSSIRYAEEVENARQRNPDAPAHPPPPPSPYMLPPLNWTSCLVLLRYGMSRLRSPPIVSNLVVYMKQVFGTSHTSPKAHNIMLDAATRLRDRPLARMVTKALFGDILPEPKPKQEPAEPPSKAANMEIIPAPHTSLVIDHPDARLNPEANERSLSALIVYLSVDSRFEELEKLIYDLIPFLSTSSTNNRDPETGDMVKPNDLPISLYAVIIEGLRKSGKTGLAQRVYNLALQAEEDAMAKYLQLPFATRSRAARPRLPINLYTSLLNIWSNEIRAAKTGGQWSKGWVVPGEDGIVRRERGASDAAWQTYRVAQRGWRRASREGQLDSFKPDAAFYQALVRACSSRWNLDSPEWRSQSARSELEEIVNEMKVYNVPVPAQVARKLGLVVEERSSERTVRRTEKDPAITLSEIMLEDHGLNSRAEQHHRISNSD